MADFCLSPPSASGPGCVKTHAPLCSLRYYVKSVGVWLVPHTLILCRNAIFAPILTCRFALKRFYTASVVGGHSVTLPRDTGIQLVDEQG